MRVGYHGTSAANAAQILATGWIPSGSRADWLGHGIYFFESQGRAWQWVSAAGAPDQTVIRARFRFPPGRLLDLTDPAGIALLASYARDFEASLSPGVAATLANDDDNSLLYLDCALIDFTVQLLALRDGIVVSAVRGAYEEGLPVHQLRSGAATRVRSFSHVQLAVRDPACIKTPITTGARRA